MALSPLFYPSNLCCASVSPSPPFISSIILQSRKQSSSSLRTLKLETLCSNQTVEFETHESHAAKVAYRTTTKKRRKPRPSFYDQIRDRWSLKIGSEREKFPWQQQQQPQKEEDEEDEKERGQEEEKNQEFSGTFSAAEGSSRNASLSDNGSFPSGNRLIAAPLTHRRKARETHFDFGNEMSQNSRDEAKFSNVFQGYPDKSVGGKTVQKVRDFEGEASSKNKSKGELRIDDVQASSVTVGVSPLRLVGEELEDVDGDTDCNLLSEKSFGFDGDVGKSINSNGNGDSIQLPWERENDSESADRDRWGRSNTRLAEKLIPEPQIQRLRNVALRMKERIKVGAAGVTQALVDCIHEKWKVDEVVKIKFEGPMAINMKRTHEVLENKTGGLVIWRCGSSLVLYRGMAYKLPCVQSYTRQNQVNSSIANSMIESVGDVEVNALARAEKSSSNGSLISSKHLSKEELQSLSDLNDLLDGLGPRFTDWTGRDPQPVDADLLPSVIPGYKPPFRLLPYGIRHGLGNKQMTAFRRIARTMPPHFALGRNRQLQGLATAMVKLWRRSSIAKIAIKCGVQNTCNERMAEELKKLTGGTLLSRNKDYIVFYSGNDFLSPSVTEALVDRQKLTELQQNEEEEARQRTSALIFSNSKVVKGPLIAGTLTETKAAHSRWTNLPSREDTEKMIQDAALARHAALVRYLEQKLARAQEKVKKAEKALRKVQDFLKPAESPTDLETVTDEERFLFRKIGLSMKPFLLLGRRGVFDGTVENIHLHWKYRELVKIIVKRKNFAQVKHIAISLEAESGGVLISLDKTTKGYAIILYRGKNYQRPQPLRPKNLLSRRQALARSIELQRREALNHHISDLWERIELLKSDLDQMKIVNQISDESLNSKLDNDYSSDDDIEENVGEEAYLETYDIGEDDDDALNEELIAEGKSI